MGYGYSSFSKEIIPDDSLLVIEYNSPTHTLPPNILLQLAQFYEKRGDFVSTLYYLTLTNRIRPYEGLLRKMSQVAKDNHLQGYELNDLNFILLYYSQLRLYFWYFALALSGYMLYVIYEKKKLKHPVSALSKSVFYYYALFLGLFFLFEYFSGSAIVINEKNYIRDSPSFGAKITTELFKGNKVYTFFESEDDLWVLVLVNWKLGYISHTNLRVID